MSPAHQNLDRQRKREASSFWRIRSVDQWLLGVATLVGLVAMGGYLWRLQRSEGVINIEQAAPLQASFKVDINQASWPELAEIPEVGRTLAERIVDGRRQAPYRSWDDLGRVPGIGPRTLEQMKPYLLPITGSQTAGGTMPQAIP